MLIASSTIIQAHVLSGALTTLKFPAEAFGKPRMLNTGLQTLMQNCYDLTNPGTTRLVD